MILTSFFAKIFGSKKSESHPLDGPVRAANERALAPYKLEPPAPQVHVEATAPQVHVEAAAPQLDPAVSTWAGFPRGPDGRVPEPEAQPVKKPRAGRKPAAMAKPAKAEKPAAKPAKKRAKKSE